MIDICHLKARVVVASQQLCRRTFIQPFLVRSLRLALSNLGGGIEKEERELIHQQRDRH
jgi:hypothetical protein